MYMQVELIPMQQQQQQSQRQPKPQRLCLFSFRLYSPKGLYVV
jgi:hypothetical protein